MGACGESRAGVWGGEQSLVGGGQAVAEGDFGSSSGWGQRWRGQVSLGARLWAVAQSRHEKRWTWGMFPRQS